MNLWAYMQFAPGSIKNGPGSIFWKIHEKWRRKRGIGVVKWDSCANFRIAAGEGSKPITYGSLPKIATVEVEMVIIFLRISGRKGFDGKAGRL